MGHQHWHSHGGQDPARHAAKYELAKPGVAVPSHHDQICANVRCIGQDDTVDADIALDEALESRGNTMPDEMLSHVGTADVFLLAWLFDHDDLNGFRTLEKRDCIADRACGSAAAVPTDEHPLERELVALNVGHDHHGAAGFEQGRLDHQIFGGTLLALRLANNGEIEAAGNTRKGRGGPADAGFDRAARDRCADGSRILLEALDRRSCGARVFLALLLD